MSLKNKYKKNSIVSTIIFCSIMLIISVSFIFYKQRILDQISVWQYHPTSEVNSIAERAGLNDNGKFYYLASQPKLESTNDFNKECNKIENTNSILGCYSNFHIYIYNVTDEQLDGVREVTAAHETLHAIYARLSTNEKNKFNKLIEVEYDKLKSDKDFSDLMAFYERTEPGERDNELHSLVGTEVSSISPELETYYSKYFANRQKVVILNAKYIGKFKALKEHDDDLTVQITETSDSIKSQQNEYNSIAKILDNDINSFNSRASSGDFSSQSQFNSERDKLITRAANLNTMRANINNQITNYEALIAEHNLNAAESQKLYNIIDSTLAPAPSV